LATVSDRLDHLLGAKAATSLAEVFGLHTVEDLLRHYPHRYAPKDEPLTETEPADGAHITVVGMIDSVQLIQNKRAPNKGAPNKRGTGQRLVVELATAVKSDTVKVTFFNAQAYMLGRFKVGRRAMMSGTVKYYPPGSTKWSLNHPGYLLLSADEDDLSKVSGGGGLQALTKSGGVDLTIFDLPFLPVYPASAKLESWEIFRCVRQVTDQLDAVSDPLPPRLRAEHGLIDLDSALRMIHFPESRGDIDRARQRLRFDEAVALQLVLATRRHDVAARAAPSCPPAADAIAAEFERRLPFRLTDGQVAVAGEISGDLSRPHPMNRLLQGEVGSGKTIVALRAMLQVVDSGRQCALLAPTEVLAAQHYRSLRTMLGDLASAGELGAADQATRVVLLTGSMSTPAKRDALLAAVSGDAGIVIGTHALIQDNVEFFDLGMVVIDEQHRFGVEQRDALRGKAKDGVNPHVLVMTATPIPRTIAIAMLGDLDISTLVELPKGRSPIVTNVVPKSKDNWVERVWTRLREQVAAGRQAYVVCSRIGDEKSETAPATDAVVDLFAQLGLGPLRGLRLGLLHGRLPADEKDAVMRAFHAGELDVLVATTVIEVGVDVPNATMMVIMDADRFGVSQLHQLRGRVGRGGHQGHCFLISSAGPFTMARLEAIAQTNDGFKLAQLDLEQRREGDVLGSAQSGTESNLKLLSLLDDEDVLAAAQVFARAIVDSDPELTGHPGLAALMHTALSQDRLEYLAKS
jgi:ATP-dependent DNA helicase RecG